MRQAIVAIGALVAGALLAGDALGQAYPAKPIRLIVSNAPGGGADLVAGGMSYASGGPAPWATDD